MTDFPQIFERRVYLNWHNSKFSEDKPFGAKLEDFMEKKKVSSYDDIIFLRRLITYSIKYVSDKQNVNNDLEIKFTSPILIDNFKLGCPEYNDLFKRPISILNKLWRKNKKDHSISLTNLNERITDLIRTRIIGDTLFSCELIANYFNNIIIEDDSFQSDYNTKIMNISVEPEIKMEAGYFAFHLLVQFYSGNIIELQINSSIFEKWRSLSHLLYDKIRLEPISEFQLGTKESRLISLGHLFHIAECELDRLQKELREEGSEKVKNRLT